MDTFQIYQLYQMDQKRNCATALGYLCEAKKQSTPVPTPYYAEIITPEKPWKREYKPMIILPV